MKKDELEALFIDESERFRANDERWTFVAHNVQMEAFTSEAKDRMRIVAIVDHLENVREDQLHRILRANFHHDARYAIHEDRLYAAYMHPLSRLSESEVRDAIRQVAMLVHSYGTRYAGGPMRFQWPRPEQPETGVRRRTVEAVQALLQRGQKRDAGRDG